jgi:hypothetical protein
MNIGAQEVIKFLIKFTALSFVLTLPAQAQTQDLLVYGRVAGTAPNRSILFLDRASLRPTTSTMREIVSIQYNEEPGVKGSVRVYITNLIDCSAKAYKVTHMSAYDDVGDLVLDVEPKDVFTPVKPGSATESYYAGACDKNWKQGLQEMNGRTVHEILTAGFGGK